MSPPPLAVPPNLLEMSREELIALLAQTLLANQQLHQQIAKMQPLDGRSTGRQRKYPENPDWTKLKKKCARCEKTKPVMPASGGFGLVTQRSGRQTPNGYCSACRSKAGVETRRRLRQEKKASTQ